MLATQIGRSPEGKKIWEAGERYHRRLQDEENKRAAKIAREAQILREAAEREAEIRRQEAINELLAKETWPEFVVRMTENHKKRSLAEIIRATAEKYELTVGHLKSDVRTQKVAIARHDAMYQCAAETTFSLKQIGRALHKDHTTVISGIRRHCSRVGILPPRGMDPIKPSRKWHNAA